MKKIFTLMVGVLCALGANAQTSLNELIETAKVNGEGWVTLTAGQTYTLSGVVECPPYDFMIMGNNATIVADATGALAAQNSLKINDVTIDASAEGNLAPIVMSANPLEEFYTKELVTPATYYTQAEADEWNNDPVNADDIDQGNATPKKEGDLKTPTVWGDLKYPNATWAGYEAKQVALNNVTLIVNSSFIRPLKAWSLHSLYMYECVVEVKGKSGKAILDWEENGAGVIQDINLVNTTFYGDVVNNDMRFHRYSAQTDPWRVWGYEGDDKNATKNTWNVQNCTFVNVCGNKEFSNNMKNTAATEFTFDHNVFVNTWRINKLGGNCKRNFTQADNLIMGGFNAVDGTDANWMTSVDDLGVVWDFRENTVPAATDLEALSTAFGVYNTYAGFGDPRWTNKTPSAISSVATTAKTGVVYNLQGQRVNANAKGIVIVDGKKVIK